MPFSCASVFGFGRTTVYKHAGPTGGKTSGTKRVMSQTLFCTGPIAQAPWPSNMRCARCEHLLLMHRVNFSCKVCGFLVSPPRLFELDRFKTLLPTRSAVSAVWPRRARHLSSVHYNEVLLRITRVVPVAGLLPYLVCSSVQRNTLPPRGPLPNWSLLYSANFLLLLCCVGFAMYAFVARFPAPR